MNSPHTLEPLAARLRSTSFDQFQGQKHLLAPGKPLRLALEKGSFHSMIFWGPPGTGKTTLAHLIANQMHAHFEKLSAILAGVRDIRSVVERAKERLLEKNKTLLFIDEIHRFNKSQQDSLLPYVEDGTLTLIGATTENPSFELNSALLSRCRIYVLKSLEPSDLIAILDQALSDPKNGLGNLKLELTLDQKKQIALFADGDARIALNALECAADFCVSTSEKSSIPDRVFQDLLSHRQNRFDKMGENFYDTISALHKAVRGSCPDAALYWFSRMLQGGCDCIYLLRRMVRMASEDIGNADPRALEITLSAWDAFDKLGKPEGELMIAQALIYLSCAPKSNACYIAFQEAQKSTENHGTLPVPLHLRNAPTKLMKSLDYGKDYRTPHDEPEGFSPGVSYFPEALARLEYYHPVNRGLEIKIKERLDYLKKMNKGKS